MGPTSRVVWPRRPVLLLMIGAFEATSSCFTRGLTRGNGAFGSKRTRRGEASVRAHRDGDDGL